ncbi:MAG: HlyD family efflux transporter periplasmic adaptor subunit [Myxococcales bacterium]|nr:HlyD family efflux transporter periplasmic adaptor subunit [Myxococcales bacterium]
MKRVVVIAVVLAVVMAALIARKIQAQNEALEGPSSGSAVVETEGVDLAAKLSARVIEVLDEGTTVSAGDVVVTLDCAEPEAVRDEAKARLVTARANADSARLSAKAAMQQTSAAHASIQAAQAQAGAVAVQQEVAEREAKRLASMGEHATVSRRDQARAAADGLQQQARGARATERVRRSQAVVANAQAKSASSQADAAGSTVVAIEALLRRAEVTVDECRIVTPRAGVIERAYFEVGELATPGVVVARVVDPSFVRATFYIPNTEVDAAKVGASVTVVADALDEQNFDGVVRRVGLEPEFTPRNVQTRTDRDRLVFPVEVRIPNEQRRLRAGMPVTVTLSGAAP